MHLKLLGLVVVDIVGDIKSSLCTERRLKPDRWRADRTHYPTRVRRKRTSLAAAQRDGSTRPHIARSSKSGSYGVITTLVPKGVTALFFFFFLK